MGGKARFSPRSLRLAFLSEMYLVSAVEIERMQVAGIGESPRVPTIFSHDPIRATRTTTSTGERWVNPPTPHTLPEGGRGLEV